MKDYSSWLGFFDLTSCSLEVSESKNFAKQASGQNLTSTTTAVVGNESGSIASGAVWRAGPILHLCPVSSVTSVPHPIEVDVGVFGGGIEKLKLAVEGLRLTQPDGILLNKLFPIVFAEAKGLIAIEVNMRVVGVSADIDPNGVFLDFPTDHEERQQYQLASDVDNNKNYAEQFTVTAVCSEKVVSSVVAINRHYSSLYISVWSESAGKSSPRGEIIREQIAPCSLKEINLGEVLEKIAGEKSDSVFDLRFMPARFSIKGAEDCSLYMIQRTRRGGKILSVVQI
ncbi:MAG TPA: hypothetical protein PKD37_04725 [Oligoflexia bacterium]|nr:hypothetical protein [Oligoflexia bacterium]HMP27269.1 hypothetical protein [Oligoflexia bacterium]